MASGAEAFRESLLPLLCCPSCRATLALEQCPPTGIERGMHQDRLRCTACHASYPITDDYIPILFASDVQNELTDSDDESNLSANIAVYDQISDDYGARTRQSAALCARIRNAVARQREPSIRPPLVGGRGIHLDFGCGPGHVLSWLKSYGFMQIGVDVSLRNLRNARKATGCFVVCASACRMPFLDASANLVTESSALHHIADWKAALRESVRVCRPDGKIVIDSEPSQAQMNWSRLARAVFEFRFPVYKALSYVMKDKYIFRDTQRAKLNLLAEVHHQPGTGFPIPEVRRLFEGAGFSVHVVVSPTAELETRAQPNWKSIVLNVLSVRNPWNPDYGAFIAIGYGPQNGS